MLPINLLLLLSFCTLLMCGIMVLQMKWENLSKWKSIPMSVLLMCTGIAGAYLMFYVENGHFGGRSLYGSIFLTTIAFVPVSRLLRICYGSALDICAPNVCVTLGFTKLLCVFDGCCQGRIIFDNVRFPSQIVEMILFFGLATALLWLNKRQKRNLYPLFLVVYGILRFGLSYLREFAEPFLIGLPTGAFWSVCSVIIGVAWLKILRCAQNKVE